MISLNDLSFIFGLLAFWSAFILTLNLIWLRFDGSSNGFFRSNMNGKASKMRARNRNIQQTAHRPNDCCEPKGNAICIDLYVAVAVGFYSDKIQCHWDECIRDSEMLQFQSNAVNSQMINRYWHFWFVLLLFVHIRFVWHLRGFAGTILSRHTHINVCVEPRD